MKKLLLFALLSTAFFACKKDKTRTVGSYGQGIDSLGLRYNKTYIISLSRTVGGATVTDTDRVIFNANGSVTEISNRFDRSSYTYPDTLTFPINTSFDYGIYWNQIPGAIVLNFYPTYDSVRVNKQFLLHDYITRSTLSIYKSTGFTGDYPMIKVTHTATDSTSEVIGLIK